MSRIPLLAVTGILVVLVACAPQAPGAPALHVAPAHAATTASTPTTTPSTTPAPPTSTTTPAARTTTHPTTTHAASARTPLTHSRAACLRNENECYEPGTNRQCETGSCVDAARGLTQKDKDDATQRWLKEHPGYCAVGTQGAVAPCDG